jgi:1-acyl-sn-glycerol-3-phosphate acyltransferase
MLTFLPGPVRGVLSLLIYTINTIFWCLLLFAVALLKFLVPWRPWRRVCDLVLTWIANNWILFNNLNLRLTNPIRWDAQGLEGLSTKQWYLVVANHQSWVDILVLQKVFFRRIPFLKFFLKKELIWVPFLGLAWWALDFPFMKRYSPALLRKKPHLRGKDLEITKKACQKFKTIPVSIMNFVEGTRFSPEKQQKQGASYRHLLNPRGGGMAFALGVMGEHINQVVNVTIAYPQGPNDFWAFLCGKIGEVKVRVESLPVTKDLLGDYMADGEYRRRFQLWLNGLWREKDLLLASLQTPALAEAEAVESRLPGGEA